MSLHRRTRKVGIDALAQAEDMVAEYRSRRMAFVAFSIDDVTRTGRDPRVTGEQLAQLAQKHPDVVIPFGSVDPNRGRQALRIAEELIETHGVRGFKFHPSLQEFYPNDPQCYPLYELLEEYGLPTLFHSGITRSGMGAAGGDGIRLKYSNPMHLDDVAVDFPDLPIVIGRPSYPWQDEAIAIAVHKAQVHLDLSGWAPKQLPRHLMDCMQTSMREKLVFGSDFPGSTPESWISEFLELGMDPGLNDDIFKGNAARLLRLVD